MTAAPASRLPRALSALIVLAVAFHLPIFALIEAIERRRHKDG